MMKRRREVELFADAMEGKLQENDYKGGWKDCPISYLICRLEEEVDELRKTLIAPNLDKILSEAADVANFAMMIADVSGTLESEVEHDG